MKATTTLSQPLRLPSVLGEPDLRLCGTCKHLQFTGKNLIDIIQSGFSQVEGYRFTDSAPNFPLLTKSAGEGCVFCSFLRDTLFSPEVKFDMEEFERIKNVYRAPLGTNLVFQRAQFSLIPYDVEAGRFWLGFEIWIIYPGHNDTCLMFAIEDQSGDLDLFRGILPVLKGNLLLRAVPPRDMLQEGTKAFLREAIETCDTYHKECKLNKIGSFTPSRLVDVRGKNVKLVEGSAVTDGSSSTPKYAALSYCWGPVSSAEHQLLTTDRNLDKHFTEIPMNQMPPLLQDAIHTTRELGISFLWVDSLCIIQGNVKDWETEASRMHQIYGQAYLTICPTVSKSCEQGFLRRDQPSISMPYHALSGEYTGTYSIRYQRPWIWKMYQDTPFHPFFQDLISGSWIRRGWTFQEAALSSRTILFGSTAAHLHCKRSRITEGEREIPVEINLLGLFPLLPAILTEDDTYSAWKHIVSSYTQRYFTKSRDSIAALAGLAQHFHSFHGEDEYCSGMWRSHFHEDLLWRHGMHEGIPWNYCFHPVDPKLLEQVTNFAPSWSWIHKRNVEYSYLEDAARSRIDSDQRNLSRSTGLLRLRDETSELICKQPDTLENPFICWRGQELGIKGFTAQFPLDNVDRPSEANDTESNTNLFWQWTILGEYFCHTSWDFLNLDLWDEMDQKSLKSIRMLLLSSQFPDDYGTSVDTEAAAIPGASANPTKRYSGNGSDNNGEILTGEHNETAFGLLLYPTGESDDKFYRVGTWHSFPRGKGGLANFKRDAIVEYSCIV